MSVEETGSLELFEGKQQEITRQELVERVSETCEPYPDGEIFRIKTGRKTDLTGF
mgnify:CR=1 FL=1